MAILNRGMGQRHDGREMQKGRQTQEIAVRGERDERGEMDDDRLGRVS